MSTTAVTNLSSSYLQSLLNNVQNTGSTVNNANDSLSSTAASSSLEQSDTGGLSPFAQLMSTLQQLQQSNPTKYAQVTEQIAKDLTTAAQTAQSQGNSSAASQLNQLATDFTNASTSGQLPNVQDLAQAIGGGHHHHHHFHAASTDSGNNSGDSSSSGTSSSGASQTLSQLLSSVQANSTSSDSLNPMTIILNTLSSAGISNG